MDSAKDKVKLLEDAQRQVRIQAQNGEISAEQYRAFQRELETARSNLSRLEENFQSTREAVRNFGQSSQNTADDVQNLDRNVSDTSQNVGELGENVQNAGNKAEKSSDGFTVMKGALADLVADGISKAVDGLKNFAKSAVDTYKDFESSMSSVKAISGATDEEFQALNDKAKELGETTKFTAHQASEAFGYMAMAGWDSAEMLDGIAGVMSLASAGGEELAVTSDIVTDALTALGLTAQDTNHFVDVLSATVSNSNTNVSMLGESFKYAAPLAGAMNASVEDLSLMLGIMANSGIKASQSGNSLKNALTNLFNPKKAQVSALKNLGLIETEFKIVVDDEEVQKAEEVLAEKQADLQRKTEIYERKYAQSSTAESTWSALYAYQDALAEVEEAEKNLALAREGTEQEIVGNSVFQDEYGNIKSLKEIVDLLRESFKGIDFDSLGIDLSELDLTDEEAYNDMIQKISQSENGLTQAEQIKNAAIIFGKQNLPGMLALINASEEDYNSLADAIYNCNDAAKDMSTTMIDNLQGDLTLFSSAVDGLKIALGEKFGPVLREVVKYATSKIPDVQKKIENFISKAVDFAQKFIRKVPAIAKTISETLSPAVDFFGEVLKNAVSFGGSLLEILTDLTPFKSFKVNLEINQATEDSRKLAENIQADIDRMNELQKSASEQVQTDFADIYKTQRFYQELQALIDQNGNVRKGYEDRVQFITNELSQATGIEIELVDGQIAKYKELQDEIENTMDKQKAQIFQNAYSSTYKEAILQNQKAGDKYGENQAIIRQAEEYIQSVKNALKNELDESFYNEAIQKYGELNEDNIEKWANYGLLGSEPAELKGAYENIRNAQSSARQLKVQVEKNNYIIQQYEKAEEEFYAGRYSLAQEYYESIDHFDRSRLENSEKNTAQLLENFQKQVDDAIKKYENNVGVGLKDTEKSAHESIKRAVEDLQKQGISGAEILRTGFIEKLSEIDGFDTSKLLEFSEMLGTDMGDTVSRHFIDRLENTSGSLFGEGGFFHRYFEKFNLPMFAKGGFLRKGKAIVGENGAELIELVNGGVQVTPLDDPYSPLPSALSTATFGQVPQNYQNSANYSSSERKTINNYFQNTIYAEVASSYDVYRLNEDLARANRQIKGGIGL